jgi:hypothetical protein
MTMTKTFGAATTVWSGIVATAGAMIGDTF